MMHKPIEPTGTYSSLFKKIEQLWPIYYKGNGYRSDLKNLKKTPGGNIYDKIGKELGISGAKVKYIQKIGSINPSFFERIEKNLISIYAAYASCAEIESVNTTDWNEKYDLLIEIINKQERSNYGKKYGVAGGDYDKRKEISRNLGITTSSIRDLLIIGKHDRTLLSKIGTINTETKYNKPITISWLARSLVGSKIGKPIGPLTDSETKFLIDNFQESVEWIAEQLNRNINQIYKKKFELWIEYEKDKTEFREFMRKKYPKVFERVRIELPDNLNNL